MAEPSRKRSWRERLNLSRLAIQFPRLTIAFWIAVAIAGMLAFSSLKYALFPDITFPVVVVNASAPLKTALETEQALTEPIETQLKAIRGSTDIDSTTYPGQAVIRARFEVGTDLANATERVETALVQLGLPPGTTTRVTPVNLNAAAVVTYALKSPTQSLEQLAQTARQTILPAIAQVPGVLEVKLLGENKPVDLSQLQNLEAALTQTGTAVRFNGEPALALQVIKQGDANTLEVTAAVKEQVEALQQQLAQVQLTQATTQATYIQEATGATIKALIEAIAIAVVVIFPFLWNWKATAISALAIPTCLLLTFIVMALFGFNLETITLLALGMIVGSLVDDAIVDVENISRHLERGEPPKQAAIVATDEVGLTVVATSLAIVAVFLPVGLMGGVLGQFFKPFGITISATMIASMLVARTLSPVLSVYWLRPPALGAQAPLPKTQIWMNRANRSYRNLLAWSLDHRGWVISLALLSFLAGLALIPLIPKGFIPKLDRGEFNVTYLAPPPQLPPELLAARQAAGAPGTAAEARQLPPLPPFNPLTRSLQAATDLDTYLQAQPDIASVFTVVGARQGAPNQGTIYVRLKSDRVNSTAAIQDQVRQGLPQLPGVTTSVEDVQFIDAGGEKPVQVRIVGTDLQRLNQTATEIAKRLQTIPGLVDISTTASSNQEAEVFTIRRNDGERIATISANLGQELTLGEASDRALAVAKTVLPEGITLKLAGDSAQVNDILRSFAGTLSLSILCILVMLFSLFRNWVDTLVIFFSLPLSMVGAMLGLLVARSDFGMVSLLGMIFLLGLTSKNAILIVDYIRQVRQGGMSRREAILEAVPTRLRPILMTTFSTILGMLPLALNLGAGVELRAPMAIAIMGGLVTASLLSLLVVPILYDLLNDWQTRSQGKA